MSDLVGNPEDRFSHNKAQMALAFDMQKGKTDQSLLETKPKSLVLSHTGSYEPRYEKTGLQCF